jgi:ATP-binding cassette subfamily F protein uup
MLKPADVLVLDEPTNDLDLDTLEALEESLLEFAGALVLVTHDRFLFDRVCTSVLALDGEGAAEPFADRAQWESAKRAKLGTAERASARNVEPVKPRPAAKRLSYLEQREWEQMEERILAAEAELADRETAAADPDIASRADVLHERCREVQAAQERVDLLYVRWAELEEKRGG